MRISIRKPNQGRRKYLRRYIAGALASALLLSMALPVAAAVDLEVATAVVPKEGEKPRVIIESNAVIDDFGDLTGYLEVALHVKTPVLEGEDTPEMFRYLGVSLEYNSKILTPVDWTAPDGVTTREVDLSTTTADSYENQVRFQTLKCNDSTTAIAHVSGPSGEDDTAETGLFYIVSEASKPADFTEDTVVAVVRFRYDRDLYQPWEEDADTWTKSDSETWLVRFAPDAVSGLVPNGSFVTQQLLYRSEKNAFYYTDDPDTTCGRQIEAIDAPLGQEYLTNLLTMGNVQAENDRDVRFTLRNLPTYDAAMRSNFATILYYDYTDRLMGVQTVLPGDARVAVNTYVERNFIHPELRASLHKGEPNYTDSVEREYSYRGIYPSTNPDEGTVVDNGADYKLTYKLDYTFYKRYTTSEVIDPDGVPDSGDEETQWTTTPVSEVEGRSDPSNPASAYLKDLPYINGWAIIDDLDEIEDVWTTFGTGELGKCDPASGSFTTSGESSYFRFADFSRLQNKQVIYVKACYEPGPLLVRDGSYKILSGPEYVRYGSDATNTGGVYAITFRYGRVNTDGYGVSRTRKPAIRLLYTPDVDGIGQTSFAVEVPVENLDIIEAEYTPSSAIMSMEYNLSDKKPYDSLYRSTVESNYYAAAVRSALGNEMNVPNNFNYKEFPIPDHLGSMGFVTTATFNQILQYGTEAVNLGSSSKYNDIMSLYSIRDMNWRTDTNGTAVANGSPLTKMRLLILDAIRAAVNQGYVDENDNAALGWHQIQYHILNANYVNPTTPITGGLNDGIPAEEAAGAYSWCHLDDCAGNSLPITDVASLLEATYDSVANGNPNAMNQLMSNFNFRTGIKGIPYVGLSDFRTDIIDVVSRLYSNSVPEAAIKAMTWREVQYLLDHKSANTIPTTVTEDYWWEGGGSKSFTLLSDMVEAFYNVKYNGYDSSWTNDVTTANLHDFLLRSDVSGTEYSLAKFYNDMDDALPELQGSGYTGGVIGNDETDTALAIQHILFGNDYETPDTLWTMTNAGSISYWWITGAPTPTDYKSVLSLAWQVYEDKNPDDENFLDKVTVELVTNGGEDGKANFWLRGGEKGQPFDDDKALRTALKTAVQVFKTAIDNGDISNISDVSWAEFQHVLLGNDYKKNPDPTGSIYWWKDGNPKSITDIPSLLEAAWNSYGGGSGNPPKDSADKDAIDKGLAAITDVKTFINGIEGATNYEDYLYLRADANGTEFGDVDDFKAALKVAINRVYARKRSFVEGLSWLELQHLLLGNAYTSENKIDSSQYWWKEGGSKPAENIETIIKNLNSLMFAMLEEEIDYDEFVADLTGYMGMLKFQDADGDDYTDPDALAEALVGDEGLLWIWFDMYDSGDEMGPYFMDDNEENLEFTWAEIQYFLKEGELLNEEDAAFPTYSWMPTGASLFSVRPLRVASQRPTVEESTKTTTSEDGLTETIEHTVITRRTDGSWTSVVTTTVVTTTETTVVTVTTVVTTKYDALNDRMTTKTDTSTEVTIITLEEPENPEESPGVGDGVPTVPPEDPDKKPENPEESPGVGDGVPTVPPEDPGEKPEETLETVPEVIDPDTLEPEKPEGSPGVGDGVPTVPPEDPEKKPENPDGPQEPNVGTGLPDGPQEPDVGTGLPDGPQEPDVGTGLPDGPQEPDVGTGLPDGPQEPNVGTGLPDGPQEPNAGTGETPDETPAETPEPPGPEPEGTDLMEGGELAMARLLQTQKWNTRGLRGLLYGTIRGGRLRLPVNTGQPGRLIGITQANLTERGEVA